MLLATLVGEADLVIRQAQRTDPSLRMPLLDKVIDEFREVTRDFTDPRFLRASRAARRRNLDLFSSRS
jgi:hypothetical protein